MIFKYNLSIKLLLCDIAAVFKGQMLLIHPRRIFKTSVLYYLYLRETWGTRCAISEFSGTHYSRKMSFWE
jgi:hypothetical protein